MFIPAPTIESFYSDTGAEGEVVILTGTNLTDTTEVTFNDVATNFTVISDTSIAADVPLTTTGPISITTPGGTATSATLFTFIPAPSISSFTPESSSEGGEVTITGSYLTNATEVTFNGIPATGFSVISDSSITAYVPLTTTGSISVTTPGGTATSTALFMFIPAPTIVSFYPDKGQAGDEVIITGTHLSDTTVVAFNGVATNFTVVNDTSITAIVPLTTTGPISVTTPGGTATSETSFIAITLCLQLLDWFSPSHATPVSGASIYLVSDNGLLSTRSNTSLTNIGNGAYEWTDSLEGYNAFMVVAPSGYTQGFAGYWNSLTSKIEVYQLPVDISGNFDFPFFDPSQTAVIPLPTSIVNIGNVYVYSEGSSPPPPDHP
jgi:hypothetical protein